MSSFLDYVGSFFSTMSLGKLASVHSHHHVASDFKLKYDFIAYAMGSIDIVLGFIATIQLIRISLSENEQVNRILTLRFFLSSHPYHSSSFFSKYAMPTETTPINTTSKGRGDFPQKKRPWSGKKAFHAIIMLCLFGRMDILIVSILLFSEILPLFCLPHSLWWRFLLLHSLCL